MSTSPTVADRVAVVALCTALSRRPGGTAPLGPSGWARIGGALEALGLRPSDLFELGPSRTSEVLGISAEAAARVAELLSAAGPVSIELERLSDRGIWTLCSIEPDYPARLLQVLGNGAPPVLFGAGDRSVVSIGGVAIVGSRKAPQDALAFTSDLGRAVARAGSCVISGGAAGIDQAAMTSAHEAGGPVVGVPADHLDRRIREPSTRAALSEGQLALVTPYMPGASFSVRTAMGRNKVVYALADVAIVVMTANGEGGTWAGAVETLDRGAPQLFVRRAPGNPGTEALTALGATVLPFDVVPDTLSPSDLLATHRVEATSIGEQVTIFGGAEPVARPKAKRVRKKAAPAAEAMETSGANPSDLRAMTGVADAAPLSGEPADSAPIEDGSLLPPATTSEKAREVGKALAVGTLGAVPVVGPVLGALLDVAWPDVKAERFERFASELARAITGVGDRLDRDFVKHADFLALAEEVLDEVGRRRNDEKLANYAAALANSALTARPEPAVRERMLDTLNAMRPRHLRILGVLSSHQSDWARPGDVITVGQVVQSRLAHALRDTDVTPQDWADLGRFGLVRTMDDTATMLAAANDLRAFVTPYGREFLSFVKTSVTAKAGD